MEARSEYRLIAQHVQGDFDAPWHLIAYASRKALPPRRFRSADELLEAVRLALPDCLWAPPPVEMRSTESYILFSRDVLLDDSQLSILGFLRPRS
jgi:hypothetical protein